MFSCLQLTIYSIYYTVRTIKQTNKQTNKQPLEQSAPSLFCCKCGQFMDNHDKNSCYKVMIHPKSVPHVAQLFAEHVQARDGKKRFPSDYLRNACMNLKMEKKTLFHLHRS